jgi:hypothetical protein
VKPTALDSVHVFWSLTDSGSDDNYFAIGVNTIGQVFARARGTSDEDATSTTTLSSGQLAHVSAVFASHADRRIWLDGVHEATNTNAQTVVTSLDLESLGRLGTSTDRFNASMELAEVGLRDLSYPPLQLIFQI